MVATDSNVEISSEATAVAQRYHRLERAISGFMAHLIGGIGGAAILFLPLITGLLVALVVVAEFRTPLFRSSGTTKLASNADPAAVIADFENTTPPVLVFQWESPTASTKQLTAQSTTSRIYSGCGQ